MVRNKERGYPNQDGNKLDGLPRAQAKYASKRADGTIQTRPAERMLKSNKRDDLEVLCQMLGLMATALALGGH